MSTYQGGLGGRDDGDLIKWTLEIDDDGMRSFRTLDGQQRAFRVRDPDARLTLHSVTRDESIAVIGLLNEMRSAVSGVVIKAPSIGDRFAGLEFD